MAAGFRWVCRIRWPRSRRSLVRHPRRARRRRHVAGPPARDRGRRRRRRPRATAVGPLGVFHMGVPRLAASVRLQRVCGAADPDLASPALRSRLRGIPSKRVFAAATAGCRRCGGPGSAGFASGSGSPGAGDGALGGGLARKALRCGGAGFTELEVTSWVISPAFPMQLGGQFLPSARPLWQFHVVHDGWLRGSRMQI